MFDKSAFLMICYESFENVKKMLVKIAPKQIKKTVEVSG